MIHEELSREIIGAVMAVFNELKTGLNEKLYERALIIELKQRGHSVSVQSFMDTDVAQMIGYLNITQLDLAILINFKNARLEWKRVLRPQQTEESAKPDLRA
jgi:hypothetical protein